MPPPFDCYKYFHAPLDGQEWHIGCHEKKLCVFTLKATCASFSNLGGGICTLWPPLCCESTRILGLVINPHTFPPLSPSSSLARSNSLPKNQEFWCSLQKEQFVSFLKGCLLESLCWQLNNWPSSSSSSSSGTRWWHWSNAKLLFTSWPLQLSMVGLTKLIVNNFLEMNSRGEKWTKCHPY